MSSADETVGGVPSAAPHSNDCENVYEHLFEYLDSEMTQEDADRMRAHLAICQPCLAELSVEELIRQVLRRSCVERAPEGLRLRIIAHARLDVTP